MSKKLLILVIFVFVSVPVFAQSVDTAWVRRYNGSGNSDDYANAIAVDGSGNVYVTGWSYGSGTGYDYAIIKYYSNGDTAWVRRYNGAGNSNDYANSIAVDGSGNVYVTGESEGSGTGYDYATIKYYSNGDTAWVRRYNGPGNGYDAAFGIAVDGSGNVYVTGRSYSSGTSEDYATIKYDPNGDTAWTIRYDGPANSNDEAYALIVDNSSNIYVTGSSRGSGTGYDYCTIKYAQTGSGVKDEAGSEEKPSEFALSQNYPNPFNPITTIPFQVKSLKLGVGRPVHTTLTIYNIRGQKVRTLVDADKVPGEYKVLWDGKDDSGKDVASGVYFYQLKVGDFSEPKKMLLLK
jgi:hypothetical protein